MHPRRSEADEAARAALVAEASDILKSGAAGVQPDLKHPGMYGMTLIGHAVAEDLGMLRMLLDANADPNLEDAMDGATALEKALEYDLPDAASLLRARGAHEPSNSNAFFSKLKIQIPNAQSSGALSPSRRTALATATHAVVRKAAGVAFRDVVQLAWPGRSRSRARVDGTRTVDGAPFVLSTSRCGG